MHHGRCKKLENPCPDKLKRIVVPTPVCGSDQKSYTSFEALICAQRRITRGIIFYIHKYK